MKFFNYGVYFEEGRINPLNSKKRKHQFPKDLANTLLGIERDK